VILIPTSFGLASFDLNSFSVKIIWLFELVESRSSILSADSSLILPQLVKIKVRTLARKLVEYIARGPLSNERLEILPSGNVNLQLKTPWQDGTTHLQFTPTEFIEKLAALIPPPRGHLVRWCGVFAPNSKYRRRIVLKPEIKKGMSFGDDDEVEEKPVKNYRWAKMLARVFKIDVSKCDHCGGDLQKGVRSVSL
jgi:hypothetical protein